MTRPSPFPAILSCLLVLLLLSPGAVFADSSKTETVVWSGLIVGSNEPGSKDRLPANLRPLRPKLKSLFGYENFELIGQGKISKITKSAQWIPLGKEFSLQVAKTEPSKNAKGHRVPLEVQVFQGRKEVAETQIMLAPSSPFIIRGPFHGKGQVIIVLMAR